MLNVSVLCFTFWNCSLENVGNGIFKPLKIKIPCRGGGGGGGGGNLFKPRLRFAPSTVNSLSPSCVLHAKCRLCPRAPTFCKECSSLKTRFTLLFYWDVAFFFSLQKFPELKFKYVEEEQPEEFFIPYVWSLVYKSSTLYWNPDHIQLFHPESEETGS